MALMLAQAAPLPPAKLPMRALLSSSRRLQVGDGGCASPSLTSHGDSVEIRAREQRYGSGQFYPSEYPARDRQWRPILRAQERSLFENIDPIYQK